MKKLVLSAILLAAGCSAPYFKHIEGEDDLIGIAVPDDSIVQVQALHHVDGDKVIVRERAPICHRYQMSSSNDYFGIVHTYQSRNGFIAIGMTNIPENVQK